MNYGEFLERKHKSYNETGFEITVDEINPLLFDFQRDIVRWSVRQGKCAIFAMTGLGKTFMQCEYARIITERENINALIVAPLAVSQQTIREAKKINIEISNLRHGESISKINIINYEQIEHINKDDYNCIILDESSILKNYSGKIRNQIIDMFADYKYKLACSATPAPNDYMELGNHSEFLDVMSRTEMLSMYFIHDSGDTQKWRLKGHADDIFWKWVASWAAIITKPSDFGYSDDLYNLPPLNIKSHIVKSEYRNDGELFTTVAKTLTERRDARKQSIDDRVKLCADMVNNSDEIWIVWCNLNAESEKLKNLIDNSVEIKGSDSINHKENAMLDFQQNKIKCLITKPKIAGHGMNWQNAHNQAFVGLSDSFEEYFQAVRRQYRFGQKKPVNVHVITADSEGAVVENIKRKEKQAIEMINGMVEHTRKYVVENIKHVQKRSQAEYNTIKMEIPKFIMEAHDESLQSRSDRKVCAI